MLAAQAPRARRAREARPPAVRALAGTTSTGRSWSVSAALAAAQLGAEAEITVDPDGEPGIVASAGHRRVDYRLTTLADRAFDALGADVATLWQ